MKRDVKVGLFVAALVCGLAAVLLGKGLVGRGPGRVPALRVEQDDAPAEEEHGPDSLGSVPTGSTEDIAPPPEREYETFETSPAVPASPGRSPATPGQSPTSPWRRPDTSLDEEPTPIGLALADDPLPEADLDPEAAAPESLPSVAAAGPDAPVAWGGPERPTAPPPIHEGPLPAVAGAAPAPGALWSAPGGGALEEPAIPAEYTHLPADSPPHQPIAPPADLVAAPPPPRHFYVVKKGESFFTISKKLFGTAEYYDDILRTNPDVNPRKLRRGQVIAVPEIPGAPLREEHLAGSEDLKPEPPIVYLAQDRVHVVEHGETLGDIAKKYYKSAVKWPHILTANPGLHPKRLRAGEEIVVPALTERPGMPRVPRELLGKAGSGQKRPRRPRVYLAREEEHVVDHGETLQHISKRYYGVWNKWHHIVKANPGLDPKRLKPGARIVIPALTE